jgi:multidrug efflux pump subunit AcrA (membrane-fusion protein)
MTKKIIYALVAVAIIVIAGLISGFWINSKPEPKSDAQKHNITYVQASSVKMVETDADMTYRGLVSAFDNVSLAAEVTGKILPGDVRLKAGESFKKGDVIVKIYSQDVRATLKSGKSSYLQTLSQILPDLKVDYSSEYNKWESFFNAIDPEKSLPPLPTIKSEKEKVFLAANNVLSGYYSLQEQEINLARYTIRAPFTGSFKTVSKEIGAVATAGSELATIIRSDKLEVVVPVFPSDLKWLHKGDKVRLVGSDGVEQTATVSRISGFIEDQSVNVYLTYNALGSNKFLEGEYVDVIFSGSKISGFEIPREALVDNEYVYEIENGNLNKVQIKVKRLLDDAVIISGIDSAKVVVTESLADISGDVEYKAR